MQYQHLVFEEFARTVQPNVDAFFAPTQVYDVDLDASIVAEFAHTVYRFGHSMLTETVDRFDPNFNVVGDPNSIDPDQQLGLIAAFLNPLAYAASGPTPEEATGAIVRGVDADHRQRNRRVRHRSPAQQPPRLAARPTRYQSRARP